MRGRDPAKEGIAKRFARSWLSIEPKKENVARS
jgi:hypothetical protein